MLLFSTPILAAEDEAFISKDATSHDFSEYQLKGKMKAPNGFFLQGKKGQSLSQMVRLRSNFKRALRNSKAAVKHGVR
jgi:hypothetical protein